MNKFTQYNYACLHYLFEFKLGQRDITTHLPLTLI